MNDITVVHAPSEEQLAELGVLDWPIWTKEVSKFAWSYDEAETCFFVEGEATVISIGGGPVKMGKGDLVTFPKGMSCMWEITQEVKKHYKNG